MFSFLRSWSDGFKPKRATFHATRIDRDAVAGSLTRHGCALIKDLFDTGTLRMFDERIARNIDGIDDELERVGAPRNLNVGFPLYFAGSDARQDVQRTFCESYPQLFDPPKMVGRDCTSLTTYVFGRLRDTGLAEVITKHIHMERLYTSAAICHIRYFSAPPQHDIRKNERGLEFHQDNRLYGMEPEILTLWFPFRYQHGEMASLEFLPRAERTLLPTITACGIDREMFPPKAFWRPAYELGDAVLISGYSPHRTYYPDTVRSGRTSIDLRFFPTPVPEPIF